MNTIGFPISHKENERRRAIVPDDIKHLSHPEYAFIEKNYGHVLGIENIEYEKMGCVICSHEQALKANIICDPKVGDADYISLLDCQTVFGWVHATQNRGITDSFIKQGLSAYAWEKMFDKGRHVFWFNNELAGEAAVLHAFQCFGELPYGSEVAVIGNGNTAHGAVRALNMLGARVTQYNRRMEQLLRDEIDKYDVIVNCVLWDVNRKDHIIYSKDLKRMRKNAMLIDVSCDKNGGIETSVPTTIDNPTYTVEGVLHYAVDHTPSLYYKTFSFQNSKIISPYIEQLITGNIGQTLKNSLILDHGVIVDREIIEYQNR